MTKTADIVLEIPLDQLHPSPFNTRSVDGSSPEFNSLVENIRKLGVQSPLLVRPHPKKKAAYEIIAGERRWRASKAAKLFGVPCLVRDVPDQVAAELLVVENLHRKDLTPLEEAAGMQKLLALGWDAKKIAAELGWAPTRVLRRARLLKLDPKVRQDIETQAPFQKWTAAHMEIVASLPATSQRAFLNSLNWDEQRGSAALLEEALACWIRQLRKAPFPIESCARCEKRSARSPGLFDGPEASEEEIVRKDRCLDQKCWDRKAAVALQQKIADLRKEYGNKLVLVCSRDWGPGKGQVLKNKIAKRKKGKKDARPCLVVEGPGTGRLFWGKPLARAATSSSGRSGVTAPRPRKPTFKEQLAHVESQRLNQIASGVEEALEKITKCPVNVNQLIGLAGVFGAFQRQYMNTSKAWKRFERLKPAEARDLLWTGVVHSLQEDGMGYGWDAPALRQICELAKIDYDALEQKAHEDIPNPPAPEPAKKAAAKKAKRKK